MKKWQKKRKRRRKSPIRVFYKLAGEDIYAERVKRHVRSTRIDCEACAFFSPSKFFHSTNGPHARECLDDPRSCSAGYRYIKRDPLYVELLLASDSRKTRVIRRLK